MSQRISVKSTIRSYSFSFLALSSSSAAVSTRKHGVYLWPRQLNTHTYAHIREPLPSFLSFFLHFVINGSSAAIKFIQCTQSEGRPGQVSEVALQHAICLSLPKVSECMGDKSELSSQPVNPLVC